MIDIHTHLLPFVDDGSPDWENSLALLAEVYRNGTTTMFLTPHYMATRNYLSTYEQNKVVFDEFVQLAKERFIPVDLHLGNEIYYRLQSVRELRDKKIVPLGSTNRVLLEFHETEELEDLGEAIHNMKALHLVPIIAHVERYSYVKEKDLTIMHKMGALIQVNASSLLGHGGRVEPHTLLKWIKLGLIDFIASDIHVFRKYDMLEAFKLVEKKLGLATAQRVFHNKAIFS